MASLSFRWEIRRAPFGFRWQAPFRRMRPICGQCVELAYCYRFGWWEVRRWKEIAVGIDKTPTKDATALTVVDEIHHYPPRG